MKENFIYLTYYQAMAFMFRINEIKKNNPYFNDEIAKSYEEYVVNRAGEIVTTYPQIKLKIFPNASKYKISKSLFNYLTRLTSIDVYDKATIKKYTIMTNELEKRTFESTKEVLEKSEIIMKRRDRKL